MYLLSGLIQFFCQYGALYFSWLKDEKLRLVNSNSSHSRTSLNTKKATFARTNTTGALGEDKAKAEGLQLARLDSANNIGAQLDRADTVGEIKAITPEVCRVSFCVACCTFSSY